MTKQSTGLLVYRGRHGVMEVLLVHPGGPFWQTKDLGVWSIPKGEFQSGDDPLEAAKREFHEETGFVAKGEFRQLSPVKQRSGKTVHAWAVEGEFDPALVRSNTFPLEWPPKSGKTIEVPEVDRAEWFPLPVAREKILPGQLRLIDELAGLISPVPVQPPEESDTLAI